MKRKKVTIKDREYRERVVKKMMALIGAQKEVTLHEDLAGILKLKKDKIKEWVSNYKYYGVGTFYEAVLEFAKSHSISTELIFGENPPEKTKQPSVVAEMPPQYEDPEDEKYIIMLKAILNAEDVKIRSFIKRDIEIFYERLAMEQDTIPPKKKIKPPKKIKDAFTDEEMEYVQQLVDILRSDAKETFEAIKSNIRVFHHSVYKETKET